MGLFLPIDGSCDKELSGKGINSKLLEINNWRIENGEKPEEIEGWGEIGGHSDESLIIQIMEEEEIDDKDDENQIVEFVDI